MLPAALPAAVVVVVLVLRLRRLARNPSVSWLQVKMVQVGDGGLVQPWHLHRCHVTALPVLPVALL